MKTHSATLRKIGDTLNSGDTKGAVIAVTVALLIISTVVAGYYIVVHPTPEGYTNIFVLDAQGKAVNYTDRLVVNENYTFNVGVENHMGQSLPCEVQVKLTNETISLFPAEMASIKSYSKTLANGERWEIPITVSLQETGSHSIVFELWIQENAGTLEFSGNAVIRKVDVVQS